MKKSRGFTLIELMVVAAIIGILGGLAMTYYGGYVQKSNRTEARGALSTIAGNLEKCRSLYGAYNSANCPVALPQDSETGLYAISAAAIAASSFTLTATPNAGTAQATDADCATLSLTNTGLKTATGDDAANCW